jgi:hypothetical protein
MSEEDSYEEDEELAEEVVPSMTIRGDIGKDRNNPEEFNNGIEGITLKMKQIKLRQMQIEIEREALKLEHDKMFAQIAHDKEMLMLETEKGRSRFQIAYYENQQERYWQDLFEEKRNRRRQERIYFLFRMLVSLLLVMAGIWLLSRGDSLGAYLLGTGAGSIGLHSASTVFDSKTQGNIKESGETSDNDKSLPRLNGGV